MSKGHVPAAVPAKPYVLERLRDPRTAAGYLSAAAGELGRRAEIAVS